MVFARKLTFLRLRIKKGLSEKRKLARSLFVVVLCCLLMAGCANHAPFTKLAPEVAADGRSDRQQVLIYLTSAVDDLVIIDAILADPDLDLLGEGTDVGEVMTDAKIRQYSQLLEGYRNGLSQASIALAGRPMPDLKDLRLCRDVQISLFEIADDLLAEYSQVLRYSATILEVSANLESLDYFDEDDLDATYETISTAIQSSIELLEQVEVPSFLIYMNAAMADSLRQMDDAVLYMLQALYFNDPLQTNAAMYRLDMLTRQFDKIGDNVVQDMADREDKLFEEINKISQLKDGLQTWASQNIDLLGGK